MQKQDVFGLGNALMDIQAFVDDQFLTKMELTKGTMLLVEEAKSNEILTGLANSKTRSLPGGSCANTMSTIALLGGHPVFTGVVADDVYGRLYESMLSSRGVRTLIEKKSEGLTGNSIILTTKDAERTMNTHLGVCREYTEESIDLTTLSNSRILHCTGYNWDTETQKETVLFVMKEAKKGNITVSFDIADPFCVGRNKEEFEKFISESVDILFGNEEEAKILTGEEDPVKAGKKIRAMGVPTVIVKVGSKGSYIFHEDEVIEIDVFKAPQVLDSTGCGDTFAGGFLYAYSQGADLKTCGQTASYVAAQIIAVAGPNYEECDFKKIKDYVDQEIIKK